MRVLPAPAGRILQDLDGLDDRELLGIVGSLRRSSERRAAACELLVGRYRNMVWSCVQWYRRGPEAAEDLMQVGYAGLLKAINNFDPAFGGSLTASARPCDAGEIKRHFRDKRWQVHVGRSVQELVLQVREATWQLTQQLGHIATDAVLAGHLGVSDADIRDARRTWGPVWRQYLRAMGPGLVSGASDDTHTDSSDRANASSQTAPNQAAFWAAAVCPCWAALVLDVNHTWPSARDLALSQSQDCCAGLAADLAGRYPFG